MKILFYKTSKTGWSHELLGTLRSVVADEKMHIARDLASFSAAVLNYRMEMPIVVAWVGRAGDVAKIRGLGDILDGLFLIIVTASNNKEILLDCRRLYPRVLINKKEDFGLIAAVIKKKLIKENSNGFNSME